MCTVNCFVLNVIHVNDIHAHFDPVNAGLSRCHQNQEPCFGGAARLYTKVKELRQINPNSTILLNGGDYYQGNLQLCTVVDPRPYIKK